MDSSHIFHNFLREKKIGGISSTIPDEIGRFRNGVPVSDDLIHIPDIEQFPIAPAEKAEYLPENELKLLFAQAQLEAIHADPATSNSASSDIVDPILEIPGEFDSIEDFIQFKRELTTVYKKRSDDLQWEIPIGVCKDPLCLNSTAPGFDYCLYHIPKDKKYQSLGLVTKCQARVEDHECTIPCSIGQQKCSFHRSMPKEANK
ncbi:hypothetical protein TRFO_04006 [Tritrichomonas foetus]|uniref:Potential DNA-binding domain-containing protein n=1 Tax=Tritrichomonas foetus TaxID=1144522 RepID=A0A1J4KI70_9EUKA|nr:hypothetical protein TRFO_04006 [Tritrichomonas foetus]|eukprot:OHT11073.1 hypothetical protein TRFO_04006 [Tritrichomonas foetus]